MTEETDVSDSWKRRFELLEKAGEFNGVTYENYKSLSFKERQKIGFNFIAFIFGPFYYFYKKMWAKGGVLFGLIILINVILTIIEMIIGTSFSTAIYQVPGAVICASLANYDFYRFKVHKETMWGKFLFFKNTAFIIAFPVISLVVLLSISLLPLLGSSTCSSENVTQLVTEIADREMGKQLGRKAAMLFSYDVDAIRTTDTNEKTGAQACAAELKVNNSNNGETNSIPITYTVENTDDGENIYVNVYGL